MVSIWSEEHQVKYLLAFYPRSIPNDFVRDTLNALCLCITLKPGIGSVFITGPVTDQAVQPPYMAMSKVILSLKVTVWKSLLRLQISVSAVAVQLARLKTSLKDVFRKLRACL